MNWTEDSCKPTSTLLEIFDFDCQLFRMSANLRRIRGSAQLGSLVFPGFWVFLISPILDVRLTGTGIPRCLLS